MSSPYQSTPDEIFSDESSFYGDDEEISRLEDLAETYDPEPYWSDIHPYLLSTIQQDTIAPPFTAKPKIPNENIPRRNARSTNESVSDFLSRLPPSSTKKDTTGQWIFVSPQDKSDREEADVATLVSEGRKLLREYEDKQSTLQAEHDKSGAKTKAGLTRKLNPLRRTLEEDIFALARETGVVSGKWMMFITSDRVDKYWEAVAKATVEGELGVAAKVATDDGNDKARLIAIYTRDTADKEDIKRVLEKMVDLGLVKEGERPIYYKCDAFTYLEILGGNPYGLKASMFSSRDVLEGKV